MNKNTLLESLKAIKIDNSLKNKPLYREELISKINKYIPKPDKKGKVLDEIRKKLNTNLANPEKKIKFESEWKPRPTNTTELLNSIVFEAEVENRKSNAFRLNLQDIVIDVSHAKFQITRGNKTAVIELLYPNANGKITIKIQTDGAEDKLIELGLEDPEYIQSFGAYIMKLVDESVKESQEQGQDEMNDYLSSAGQFVPSQGSTLNRGSFSPNWESAQKSDSARMKELMTLVEQEEKIPEPDEEEVTDKDVDNVMGASVGGDAGNGESGEGDEAGFGKEDFSLDAGGGLGGGGGLGSLGGGGGSDFGGFGGGEKEKGVNADEGEIGLEDKSNYMTFRDKTDWTNASLDAMQKLVSTSVADKMQEGTGVVLTSDEILNGTVGMKGDTNYDVIDKFLKVYPELDNIDLKEEDLNQIETKLPSPDFDAWLQQELPKISGEKDVDETLNNEMFEDFKPMGGETEEPVAPIGPEPEFPDLVEKAISSEKEKKEDIKTPEEKEAELEIGGMELPEFPNIGKK